MKIIRKRKDRKGLSQFAKDQQGCSILLKWMRQTFRIQTTVRKKNSKAADVQLNKTQCKTSENVKTKNCYPLTSIYAAMVALLDPEGSLSFFIASNMRSSSLNYIHKKITLDDQASREQCAE